MGSNLANVEEDEFTCMNAEGGKGKCCYSCIGYLSILIFMIAAFITFVCVYPPKGENKKIRDANISKIKNVSDTNEQSKNVAKSMIRKILKNQDVDLSNWNERTVSD
ncbi:hypothetical protein NEAUS03_1654 [Nematocida ausubeli]|nr:hypothetical protein NEAUS03_1654 [Nematocida ausubeli]